MVRDMFADSRQSNVLDNSLRLLSQGYDQKDHRSVVAVTAGNKAFIWWSTTGVYEEEW